MNFAIKRTVSLMLVLLMVFSGMTVAQAAGSTPRYVTVDISDAYNAEVYKSSAEGADLTFNRWNDTPDYLSWGSTYYYRRALNIESIAEQLDENGMLYDKAGVPYSMPLERAINVQGEITPSTTVDLEDGAYSKIHFLAAVLDAGADTTTGVEVAVNYDDGTSDSVSFSRNMYGASGSKDVDSYVMTAQAHSTNWNNESGENLIGTFGTSTSDFNIYTYSVDADTTKTVTSITFSSRYKSTCAKVLAITAVGIDSQEYIDALNAAIDDGNYRLAQQLLAKIETCTDDTALNFLASDEYMEIKSAIEDNISYFSTVDIGPASNAEVYKDGSDMSYNVASSSPDYFPWGSTWYFRYGLKKDSVAAQLTDGIAYDNAYVPYSMPLEKAINVQGSTSPSTTVDVADGMYAKVHFLSAAVDVSNNTTTFRVTLNYTDGSTSYIDYNSDNYYGKATTGNSLVMTVDAYNGSWTEKTSGTNTMSTSTAAFGIHTYALSVTDGKTLDSVTFSSDNLNTTAKILAVTLETPSLGSMLGYLEDALADLDALMDDNEMMEQVAGMVEVLQENDVDLSAIPNYEEFLDMKEKMVSFSGYTVETDGDTVNVDVEFSVGITDADYDTVKLFKGTSAIPEDDYTIEQSSDNTLTISFKNGLDFSSQYSIVLSADIRSAADAEYYLGKDVTISFVPEAQVKITSFEIYDSNGSYASLAEAAGKEVSLKAVLAGDEASDIFITLYDADNMMTTVLSETTNPVNGEYIAEEVLMVPENTTGFALECYVFGTDGEMKLLYPKSIIK